MMRAEASAKRPERLRPQLVPESIPAVEWNDYPRIEPGVYRGYCRSAKWYRDPQYNRWTCLLRFDVFAGGSHRILGTIPLWVNGGRGAKPKGSLRGKFLPLWIKANGGPPPRKDRLSPSIFTRRMAGVRVADTESGPLQYSVIREIVEWETGGKRGNSRVM